MQQSRKAMMYLENLISLTVSLELNKPVLIAMGLY